MKTGRLTDFTDGMGVMVSDQFRQKRPRSIRCKVDRSDDDRWTEGPFVEFTHCTASPGHYIASANKVHQDQLVSPTVACLAGRRLRRILGSVLVFPTCSLLISCARAEAAQLTEGTGELKVFLDCPAKCDEDFLRTTIEAVSYVRDREDADVHILLTSQPTGAGGDEYSAQFIGNRRFAAVEHTLKFTVLQLSTADERRRALAEVIKRGLVRYMADTALADRISITFLPDTAVTAQTRTRNEDPWNLWVFRTTFSGTFNGESSNTGHSVRVDTSASRTSEDWKVSFSASGSYRSDSFVLSGDETFRSTSRSFGYDALIVKSITDHWSMGVVGNASTSTFLNYDLNMRTAAGVEYNLFPYSESTERLLTLQYTVGVSSFDYREETIYGATSERLPDHRMGVLFTMFQPWGTAGAEASFSQFVTKPGSHNLNVIGQANVRLTKGFTVNFFASMSRPRDQLYLPREDATLEEILVRERQLATSYRYSMVLGFTYTFGSIFNSVVNPRFGRAGDNSSLF